MKKYNKPTIEICSFDVKDIITLSGEDIKAADLTAGTDAAQAYEAYSSQPGAIAATSVKIFRW